VRLAAAVAVLVVLAAPAPAVAATAAAEVLGAQGSVLASARGGSFRYPADGTLLSIESVQSGPRAVTLRGVSILSGRVTADAIVVRTGGRATIENLVVDGLLRDVHENSLFGLDASGYVVALQKATIPAAGGKRVGFVALRVDVGAGYAGLPRGGQLLIGIHDRSTGAQEAVVRRGAIGAWATLGFAAPPQAGGAGLVSVVEPLLSNPLLGSQKGAQAVWIAERFLGVPYVWGGATPSGFDCSGLAMYVYAQLGIHLTHFTGAQYNEGAHIPPALLQPGDLVFFDGGQLGPGHEGIYIGNGMFIHAPHTGDVVKISSLASYWGRYYGAVRPY
jgi:hypothetical protein